ncbi:MAG: YdiU family protein [Acidobacteriota bacterium]
MSKDPAPSVETARSPGWRFDHSYSRLPQQLWDSPDLSPVSDPRLSILNRPLAEEMGLDPEALAHPNQVEVLAGNRVPKGGLALAQAYAGHQFGHFTRLGDGRAMLLGEHLTPDGRRLDVQLKGSGRTVFSRGGDGRAPLGPMLREYVISEAIHELGIPTTRSLAVVETGEPVFRDGPLPGAVLTRIASSHIRVGTFEYATALRESSLTQALVEATIERHFPELAEADDPAIELLRSVAELQADLIARWLAVGFIHGVMNTDNMTLCGETIDYGPCAFLDAYHPDTVFSSIDRHGRYAFGRQVGIALWNLARFAESLLPLLDSVPERAVERAQETVDTFPELFERRELAAMRAKLGLLGKEHDDEKTDEKLVSDLLSLMAKRRTDYTNAFRDLIAGRLPSGDEAFSDWMEAWKARLARQPDSEPERILRMQAVNPAVIPRNHRVEEALSAASEQHDLGPFRSLLAALADPYDHARERPGYDEPAPPSEVPYRTFCGT